MLRIRLVGGFAVERDGRELNATEVGSRKGRTALKVLAAHRGRTVPIYTLVDALWREHPPADAPANVATLVSRLRATFGAGVIEGTRAGYRLVTGPSVIVDVDEAARLVAEAEARLASGQPSLAVVAADAALDALSAGGMLDDDAEAEWAVEAGRDAARLLRRARAAAWQAASAVADHRRALTVAADAVAEDPLDEEAHRAVMLAYHRLGEPGEALAAYERLRTVLVEELGTDPGRETERVYLAVLRGEALEDEVAVAPHPRAAAGGTLVGRARDLDALTGRWAAAVRGSTTCVLVTGEAGIGKTALAGELARQAQATGALVLEARCYEAERSLFLQPLVEVLRTAVARLHPERLREAVAPWAGPLGALVPELDRILEPGAYRPVASELERRHTFEAVSGLLVALARQRPVLVVLDDLHLAGASTVELLHFLLRWERAAPLLVLATVRSDEGDEAIEQLGPMATVLELGPLSEGAVAELAARMGVRHPAADVVTLTRGHALFVVEALRALAESESGALRLPASLQSAVSTRARRCGREVEEMLRVAAVAGAAVDVDEVADLAALSPEEVARRAERACRAGLLVNAGHRYEFANQLVRSALYETTPTPTRVLRHRRLARRLAASQPEAAGAHAAAAGEWELAVRSWLEAARRAAAVFANRDAETLLSQALDTAALIDVPALVARVQFERGRARLALGRYEDATADLAGSQQLARALGLDELDSAAGEQLGWAAYHARDARVVPLAERAVAHPAAGPGARVLWGRVRNLAGDVTGAIAALEAVTSGGDVEATETATATSYLATALCHADRFGDAARVADKAIDACRRTGALRAMLNARMFGAMARGNLGDFSAALDLAETLRNEAVRFDASFYRPRALNILAWVWRELGQPERARDLATEALEECSRGEGRDAEREPAANALLALAESEVLAGDPPGAVRWLADIDPLLGRGVAYAWRIQLRQLELLARLEPARGGELLKLARRGGSAKYEALALAHLRRHDEAATTAARTGSDWLVAAVAEDPTATQAAERLAAGLPQRLRADFLARGALMARRRELGSAN